MTETIEKRGRTAGIARKCYIYIGVKTKVVRAPVEVANKISDMLGMFNKIKSLVNSWDERISEAASKSATGKPSPKYERAIELLK